MTITVIGQFQFPNSAERVHIKSLGMIQRPTRKNETDLQQPQPRLSGDSDLRLRTRHVDGSSWSRTTTATQPSPKLAR